MNIEDIQQICNTLPGTTTDIKWEDHLCFNVGNKMYLVTSPDKYPHTASFKTSNEEFSILCEMEGFAPAPYLARYKWVFVDDISRISIKKWEEIIRNSYTLIHAKLPGRIKKEILNSAQT